MKTNNNITICNNCGKKIKIKIKQRKSGELIEKYFRCKLCYEEYHIIYENETTLKLEKQLSEAIEMQRICGKNTATIKNIENIRLQRSAELRKINRR